MTRETLLNIWLSLKDLKNGFTGDALVRYIKLRMSFKYIAEEFDKMRAETAEQATEEEFKKVMQAWLNEEETIDTHIFAIDELSGLIEANEMNGWQMDYITDNLMRNEKNTDKQRFHLCLGDRA